jgi:hypothetical protein
MKRTSNKPVTLRTLTAAQLVNVAGGDSKTTAKKGEGEKASSFELHFTCESVDFTNIK